MTRQHITLVVALIIIVVAIGFLQSRKIAIEPSEVGDSTVAIADSSDRVLQKEKKYERAKEISTPDGFINTDPVTIESLVGKKIILVDFWTYSCINCQRTIPYLESWYEKYADKGLVILGVHTPEFEFEKDFENVRRAVEKFGIKYPVVLDNDYSTWRAYKNQYWPRKYLIDIDGFIVYDHIGEGGYDETEEKIVELLNERNRVLGEQKVARDMSAPEDVDKVDFSQVRTPETYLGYARLEYLANLPSTDCFDTVCTFVFPEVVPGNSFVLDGEWKIQEEEAVSVGSVSNLAIAFSANKVNLVAGATDEPIVAEIYLDGERISDMFAGSDVKDGQVTFSTYDLYNLVDLRGVYGEHLLVIRFLTPKINAFAFTFG